MFFKDSNIHLSRSSSILCILALGLLIMAGCSSGGGGSVSQNIGPDGGIVTLGGLSLNIPAGALTQDTKITINTVSIDPPAGVQNLSSIYRFQPPDQLFLKDCALTVPYQQRDGVKINIYWSSGEDTTNYTALSTTCSTTTCTAAVRHFSYGFVGAVQMPEDGGSDAGNIDGGPDGGPCVPESDAIFCSRYGKNCGELTETDNCGTSRTVASCGTCASTQTCDSNVCTECPSPQLVCLNVCCALGDICDEVTLDCCTQPNDQQFCHDNDKWCGIYSGVDICGKTRTDAVCGDCPSTFTCDTPNNQCIPCETGGPVCGNDCCDDGDVCYPADTCCSKVTNCAGKCGGDDGCGGTCPDECTERGYACVANTCTCATVECGASLLYCCSGSQWCDSGSGMCLPACMSSPRGSDICYVPDGEFQMGCNPASETFFTCGSGGHTMELPLHTVEIKAFFVDKNEVTVLEYENCVNDGGCTAASTYTPYCTAVAADKTKPINCVTRVQANDFCTWAGKALPTESEWEKASRAKGPGVDDLVFPWGNTPNPGCGLAVVMDGGTYGCGNDSPMPVGSFPDGVSPFGANDMIGNLSEWVADCYHSTYDGAPDGGEAWTTGCVQNSNCTSADGCAVIRGGSFDILPADHAAWLRTAYRSTKESSQADDVLGFRCVLHLPGQ